MVTPHPVPDASRAGTSTFANALWMAGGEIGARGLAFLAMAYLTRRLGPSGFGIVGFATAFAGYFGLVVAGGVGRLGARAVARAPQSAPALAVGISLIRLPIAGACFGALWLFLRTTSLAPLDRTVVQLAGLTLFALAIDTTWAYKGLEQGGRIAAAGVVGQLAMLGATVLLVDGVTDIVWVPVALFIGDATAALLLLVPLAVRARELALSQASQLLRGSRIPMATRAVRVMIFTFDIVLLGFLSTRADVGLYTAAYRVSFLVLGIQVAVHSSFWAAAARASDARALGQVVSRALSLASVIALPLLVGGIVVATPLMSLMFGTSFAAGGTMLQWLLISVACALGHEAFTVALLASGEVRRELAIMSAAAVVNVVANLAVIPSYGARGAAIVTAVSEGVALLLCVHAGHRAGWRVRAAPVRTSAAAAAVMGGVLLAIGSSLPLIVRLLVAPVVYILALGVFGIPDEAAHLIAPLRRLLARS
jgi:O-antigen/teichoic acid export membrane protein